MSATPQLPCCGTCKNFDGKGRSCRSKSPTVFLLPTNPPSTLGLWPPTKAENWCGEHKSRVG
jgi:hypothetical protein